MCTVLSLGRTLSWRFQNLGIDMKHYKDQNNRPFYEPSPAVIAKYSLTAITEQEFNDLVLIINTPTPEQIQQQTNAQARAYLASTDWYVIRQQENGTPIPQEILDARQAARDSIIEVGGSDA